MASIILFHHALGLTASLRDYVDTLRSFGHDVSAPDLFDGHTFADVHKGVTYAESMGFDTMVRKAEAVADLAAPETVFIGFSLGVLPAQHLVQTRPRSRGAVLMYACAPEAMIHSPLRDGTPVQIHGNEFDPFFVHDGDLDNARAMVAASSATAGGSAANRARVASAFASTGFGAPFALGRRTGPSPPPRSSC